MDKSADLRKAVEILLVDDNSGDSLLISELLADSVLVNHVHTASNGWTALQRLRKEGPFRDAPTIDLVLLDINMPVMSGFDVLREMGSDPGLRALPVIVLTSSDDENDIRRSYELRARCYIIKPGELAQLEHIVRSIERYWLSAFCSPGASAR